MPSRSITALAPRREPCVAEPTTRYETEISQCGFP